MDLQGETTRPCVLALGFFDGLHRGHLELLREVSRQAKKRNVPGKMLTFEPHPDIYFHRRVELLTRPEDRAYLAKTLCGVELAVLKFDEAVSSLSPEQFAEKILMGIFSAAAVVVGQNFTFGKNASGNAELLQRLCRERDIGFTCIPSVSVNGSPVSSTRIRSHIKSGEIPQAEVLLGHPYLLSGTVEKGKQVGRTLSFPTANLSPEKELLLPAPGVYATFTELPDGRIFPSVTNVGTRPTVDDDRKPTVETHLIGFRGDLYGQPIRVFFDSKLREIRKFSSLKALSDQISEDAKRAEEHIELRKIRISPSEEKE